MVKKLFLLFSITLIISCKSTKTVQTKKKDRTSTTRTATTKNSTESNTSYDAAIGSSSVDYNIMADKIVEKAKQYEGTRYKYGGMSKKGMDCSGLVVTSFNSKNIPLPRTTSQLASTGDWIDLKEVKKGDLLFFATRKNSRKVNHVGIVTEARVGYVEFIHASTTAGVIISSLSERYWYFAFVQARRIL